MKEFQANFSSGDSCGLENGARPPAGTGFRGSRGAALLSTLLCWLACLLLCGASNALAQTVQRIHAGGGDVTDSSGQLWGADRFFVGGFTYAAANSISGTSTPSLYQTERAGIFSYKIPAPTGRYRVTLHFAEIYFKTPGKRVFKVNAEGTTVVQNLDLVATVGSNTAHQSTFEIEMNDGTLDLDFLPVFENPKLSAIEVTLLRSGPPPVLGVSIPPSQTVAPVPVNATLTATVTGIAPGDSRTKWTGLWEQTDGPAAAQIQDPSAANTTVRFTTPGFYCFRFSATLKDAAAPSAKASTQLLALGDTTGQPAVRIKAGGGAYTDAAGQVWMADTYFTGGGVFAVPAKVQGTSDSTLYQSERFGLFKYSIPLRSGLYQLRLHFAEIWFKSPGSRVFNVSAEGSPFATGLDIVQSTGAMNAMVLSKPVRVSDGALDLQFNATTDNAKISAIEVLPLALETPPLSVSAGPDQQLQLPKDTLSLTAQAAGTAYNAADASCKWTQLSGPQNATIDTPSAFTSQFRFQAPGSYRFQATVTSGAQSGTAEVGVQVLAEVLPPFVITLPASLNAGPVPLDVQLSPTIQGVPIAQMSALRGLWEQTAGPAPAAFASPTLPNTSVRVTDPGLYTFRFTSTFNGTTTSGSLQVNAVGDIAGQDPVRIHAGGIAYKDSQGNLWSEDRFFKGGSVFSMLDTVKGTPDSPLYQTERFGTFGYQIPLRNGLYNLRLHFAELWFKKAGQRVFGVNVEGKTALSFYDIFQSAGLLNATVWSSNVRVSDGVLNIDFLPWTEQPKVAAIEVLPLALDAPPLQVSVGSDQQLQLPLDTLLVQAQATGGAAQLAAASCQWSQTAGPLTAEILTPNAFSSQLHFHEPGLYKFKATVKSGPEAAAAEITISVQPVPDPPGTVRIHCGGGAYTDAFNRVWSADSYYTGGFTYATGGPISGTTEQGLYLTERSGNQFGYRVPVTNGKYTVRLHFAEIFWKQPQKRVFSVSLEGAPVINNLDLCATAGPATAYVKEFQTNVSDGILELKLTSQLDNAKLSAIEIVPNIIPDHMLHVVIRAPETVVDYGGSGMVSLNLIGSPSHTHEFGQKLTQFEWREDTQILSTAQDFTLNAPLGTHRYTLKIWDSKTPPSTLEDSVTVQVLPASNVPGVSASYFSKTPAPGASPTFVEILPTFRLEAVTGGIGGSGLSSATVLLQGVWNVTQSGTYSPVIPLGTQGTLLIDGQPWTAALPLTVGPHSVSWQFTLASTASLPLELTWKKSDGTFGTFTGVAHDETVMPPQINLMATSGPAVGGDMLEIRGLGFFPSGSVSVLWGGRRLSAEILESDPGRILILTPSGSGSVPVSVQTPQGTSNSVLYTYKAGTAPVQFQTKSIIALPDPTQAAWGPDGRLYVACLSGAVTALELDDQYNVLRSQIIPGVQGTPNNNVLGIGFSPWESAAAFNIYLGHAKLFITNGICGVRPAPYIGQVSALPSPLFQPVPLITGLPSSNHDHGVNGITFDNRGQLYAPQGGNTNAGVPSSNLGGLEESPLSESIVVATIRDPRFNGRVSYTDSLTGAISTDQNDGGRANVTLGTGLRIFATGLRNAFDIVWGTSGQLYGTDNGPNVGFGKASLTATTDTGDPGYMDKVLLLGRGHYYGHANRNRGRYDSRENRYRAPWDDTLPELYTQPLVELPSSKDGIDEYRATAFGGALRGSLLVQEWNGNLSALRLSSDGRYVESVSDHVFGTQRGLDVLCGPGGAIVVVDYSGGGVNVSLPDDKAATSMVAYDIFPWRAPASGGFNFVIGGKQFGTLADTTVRFGTVQAKLTSVSSQRIKGVIPSIPNPTAAFLPLVVESAGKTSVIPDAFRYLLESGQGTGIWREEVQMPIAPGATTAAEIGGLVYVLSEDSSVLQAFDTVTGEWTSNFPAPPVKVTRPTLVKCGVELVLIGNIPNSSVWLAQIYSPFSRTWIQGAPGPWNSEGPAVAAIGRSVYAFGGASAGAASPAAAVYDVDKNLWKPLPPLPLPVQDAAAASDGDSLWVFGGQLSSTSLTIQRFDPATSLWTSVDTTSAKPMPNRLGARAEFFAGEFYLFGGRLASDEPLSSVDALLIATLQWRSESALPEPAWGVGSAAGETEIFVTGGRGAKGPLKSARALVR